MTEEEQLRAVAVEPVDEVGAAGGERRVDLVHGARRVGVERLGQQQVVGERAEDPAVGEDLDRAPRRVAPEGVRVHPADAEGAPAGHVQPVPPGQRLGGGAAEAEAREEEQQLLVAPRQPLAPVAHQVPQLDADRAPLPLARPVDRPVVPAVDVLEVVADALVRVGDDAEAAAGVDLVHEVLRRLRAVDHLVHVEREEVVAVRRDLVADDHQHVVEPALARLGRERVVVGDDDPAQPGISGGARQVIDAAAAVREAGVHVDRAGAEVHTRARQTLRPGWR